MRSSLYYYYEHTLFLTGTEVCPFLVARRQIAVSGLLQIPDLLLRKTGKGRHSPPCSAVTELSE